MATGTDPVTADRDVEAVAAVLGAHDWRWAIRDSATGDGVRIACTAPDCDWHAERLSERDDAWAEQRAHVAAALLPLIREREAAAKAEVYDEAAAEFWRIFLRLPQTPSPLGDYVQRRHQGFKGQAIALRAANPYAGSEGA